MSFSLKSATNLLRDSVVYRDSALALNSINKIEGRLQYIYDTSNVSPYAIAEGLGKLSKGGIGGLLSLDALKNLAKKIAFPTTIKAVGPLEELPISLITSYPRVLAYTHTKEELTQLRDNAFFKKSKMVQPSSFLEAFQRGLGKASDNSNVWSAEKQYSQNISERPNSINNAISNQRVTNVFGRASQTVLKVLDRAISAVNSNSASDGGPDNFIDFSDRKWRPQSDSISRKKSTGISVIDDQILEAGEADKYSSSSLYSSNYSNLQASIKEKLLVFEITAMHIAKAKKFPAFIKSFSENLAVSWNDYDFLARSEPLAVYGQTNRSYSLDFMLVVEKEDLGEAAAPGDILEFARQERIRKLDELNSRNLTPIDTVLKAGAISLSEMYSLLEFLQACTRPRYAGNSFAASPVLKLTLGDFIKDQTFIIESLGISYDPLIWDMQTFVAPRFAHISMSGRFFGAKNANGNEVMPKATGVSFYSKGNK